MPQPTFCFPRRHRDITRILPRCDLETLCFSVVRDEAPPAAEAVSPPNLKRVGALLRGAATSPSLLTSDAVSDLFSEVSGKLDEASAKSELFADASAKLPKEAEANTIDAELPPLKRLPILEAELDEALSECFRCPSSIPAHTHRE